MFPGMVFHAFLIFNHLFAVAESTGEVSTMGILQVALLWGAVATSMVFVGSHLGHKAKQFRVPSSEFIIYVRAKRLNDASTLPSICGDHDCTLDVFQYAIRGVILHHDPNLDGTVL
jgi:hypothetical protein